MAIGSINSGTVSTAVSTALADKKAPEAVEKKATIAEHVAALDEQEPIRSASTTLGTLVDTYL